jgi:hypothetical protein
MARTLLAVTLTLFQIVAPVHGVARPRPVEGQTAAAPQSHTWNFVADFAADPSGATDMSATMVAAFQTIVDAGGGTLYFPPGIYLLSRPCQDTGAGGANAQVPFPTIELNIVGVTTQQPTLRLVGALPPPTSGESSVLPTSGYTVFKSTLTGGSGSASVFANKVGRNNLHLEIENFILQLPPDPSVTGWNLADQNDVILKHLLVHSGSLDINGITQPTHLNQFGIVLPQNNHSANTIVMNTMVWGSYTGYKTGELALLVAGMNAESCVRGVLIAHSHHANIYHSIGLYECAYGLVAAGDGDAYFDVQLLDFENANGQYKKWQDRVLHIDDPGNHLRGKIRWHAVNAGVGVMHSLSVSGGSHLTIEEIGGR